MPKQVLIYSGWVGGKEIDRIELETMGVEIVTPWNPIGTFDHVRMTVDIYRIFCRRWKGRFVWGLRGKVEEVYSQEELGGEDVPF